LGCGQRVRVWWARPLRSTCSIHHVVRGTSSAPLCGDRRRGWSRCAYLADGWPRPRLCWPRYTSRRLLADKDATTNDQGGSHANDALAACPLSHDLACWTILVPPDRDDADVCMRLVRNAPVRGMLIHAPRATRALMPCILSPKDHQPGGMVVAHVLGYGHVLTSLGAEFTRG